MYELRFADGFRVDPADFTRDLGAIRAVREPVFLVEQKVPPELEWDELDPLSRHVVARDFDGRPIGTGRLTPEQRIGRMAVLANWRGKGVGEAMLMRLLDQARDMGYLQIELHAQTHAIPFYARAGFVAEGDEFMEAGIPHQIMRIALQPRAPITRKALPQANEQPVETLEECRLATLEVLKAARHRICMVSRDLDPSLLCNEAALAELRRVALSGRGAEIRLIVQDPVAALRLSGQLVALAQRSPATIAIRTPTEEIDLNFASAYLLNDSGGYVYRPLASRFEASTHLHAGGRNRQLQESFDKVWERSEVPVELRTMRI
ncbi:MAG: GNAT family N-acetyltransferase [Pseudomarimonas sp.]